MRSNFATFIRVTAINQYFYFVKKKSFSPFNWEEFTVNNWPPIQKCILHEARKQKNGKNWHDNPRRTYVSTFHVKCLLNANSRSISISNLAKGSFRSSTCLILLFLKCFGKKKILMVQKDMDGDCPHEWKLTVYHAWSNGFEINLINH